MRSVIGLLPDLTNREVGSLVDSSLIDSRHPDSIALDADQWASVRQQVQALGRAVHWWEVPNHG